MIQPHLVVRCWGNGVSAGPLVLAGQTSCLRCADLARSDADPQWPVVLSQLSRLRLESPPALVAWAASVAAAQALAFLHGELPESAGATLEAELAGLRHATASLASSSQLRLQLAQPYRIGAMEDQPGKPTNGVERHLATDIDGNSLARSAFRRGAKLAFLPLGVAGRATLRLGRRLGGAPADEVSEQLQQRGAEQLFRYWENTRAVP